MSIIRAIKHRLGLSVTPANNFTFDASADNGTMKLARESGQDIITVDAAGKVAFPQMGQSLVANGYVKLPGGLVIQWGVTDLNANGVQTDIPLSVAWPTRFLAGAISLYGNTPAGSVSIAPATGLPLTYLFGYNSNPTVRSAYWIAIGH